MLHNFSVAQILREIKVGESRSAKIAFFTLLVTLNFVFGIFQLSKSAKRHKNQNSEPLNVVKWQILRL